MTQNVTVYITHSVQIFTNNYTESYEPHHFYAAPALGKNFNAAPAAPAPTLL
jgi:hypothetical protein